MNKISDQKKQSNEYERRDWSYFQDLLEDKKVTNSVLKFHYKTINRMTEEIKNPEDTSDIMSWAGMVAYHDILPETFEEIIELEVDKKEKKHSSHYFEIDSFLEKKDLGQLLYDSFGREFPHSSKNYPSAGGLYPVIPLMLILKKDLKNNLNPGCYVFDSTKIRFLKICQWNNNEINKVKKILNYDQNVHPPYCIAYALDIRRAVTKYYEKGYRHGLIEVGLMAQSFREATSAVDNLGERCWSYFTDISLTHACGLNFRLCPITLIQWFGYKVENNY